MVQINTPEQTDAALRHLGVVADADPTTEPTIEQLHCQRMVGEVAWTAGAYADAERRAGCRAAVAALVAGNRRLALDVLLTSFTRQLRIHGLGYAALEGRPYEQMGGLR